MPTENELRWKIGIILLMSMLLASLGTIGGSTTEHSTASDSTTGYVNSALTPHDPILINHDDNFTQQGFEGLGTEESPYLIEGLHINIGPIAIWVINTSKYFTILDCLIDGYLSRIYLNNVTNGRISGCVISPRYTGIYLQYTMNITIDNNQLDSNLVTYHADNSTIVNNTCNAGIEMSYSEYNILDNNIIIRGDISPHAGVGLKLYYSPNNTIIRNNLYECGMYLYIDWNDPTIRQTLVENNTVNDKPLVFLQDTSDIAISHAGQIIITNCSNILIEEVSIDHTMNAMVLRFCENITIRNCLIQDTYEEGIIIGTSTNNTYIHDTQVFNTAYTGIVVSSFNTTITNVHVWNASTALTIWSDNASVTESIFQGDRSPYYDIRVDADNVYFHRNYYSNYSGVDNNNDGYGDTNYTMYGTARTNDTSPYMYLPIAPEWSPSPTDKIANHSLEAVYEIPVISDAPITTWSVNDTQIAGFDDGILTVYSTVDMGEFGLELYIENIYGIGISTQLSLTVLDTLPPTWTEGLEDISIEIGEDFSFQLEVTELNGIDRYEVEGSTFHVSDEGLVTNMTRLDYGVYNINVSVIDIYDNCLNDSFRLTVEDNQVPILLLSPDDLTYTEGATGNELLWRGSDHTPHEWKAYKKMNLFPLSPVWIGIGENGTWTGQNISINVDGLEVGTHEFMMVLTDEAGNEITDEVTVVVEEDTTGTTTTSTTTIPNPPPSYDLLNVVIGFVSGGLVIGVVFIILIRTRRIGGQ